MENPRTDTRLLKRYIRNSVDDARLLIAERELNEFSDNAESISIIGKGNNRTREIISQLKIRFDEIDLTKVNKLLCCMFYNPNSSHELHINDVYSIFQFFDRFSELITTIGLYQNDSLEDAVELIIIFE